MYVTLCIHVCNSVYCMWCRTAVRRGESIRYLVPDLVIEYIMQHKLYLTVAENDVTWAVSSVVYCVVCVVLLHVWFCWQFHCLLVLFNELLSSSSMLSHHLHSLCLKQYTCCQFVKLFQFVAFLSNILCEP